MKSTFNIIFGTLLGLFFLTGCGESGGGKTTFISITTGSETGVYYPAGGGIAEIVNQQTSEHGIKASAQTSKGSVDNINSLLAGNSQFGIAQSDAQFNAVKGLAAWEGKPQDKLRFVLSLHPESVTLVAAADSGISSLADLKGKRVNLGEPGSGTRGNAEAVLQAAGIDPSELAAAEGLNAKEAPRVLQDDRIDAFFYTVGHPAGAIEEATSGTRVLKFVPITGMDELLAKYPYFRKTTINRALYPKAEGEDAETFGFVTTVVTSSDIPDEVVYQLTRAVFENLDAYRKKHPALQNLEPEEMIAGGTAPLHPGAERYYREAGLLK
jgi:TRAP transporter TAXI family solute receptor